MNGSTESRMAQIEQDIKSLKGSYPTAGSLVQLYVTTASFTATVKADYPVIRIKFSPEFRTGGAQMVTLSGMSDQEDLFLKYYGGQGIPEPQDGTGDAVIRFQLVSQYIGYEAPEATIRFTVTASGTSPGTFSRIA